MSNIFYTEVDKNLQTELNARGRAGFSYRTTKSLNFMLGKVANVQLTAYEGNDSKSPISKQYGVLGGLQLQTGRYMPSGKDGFLTEQTYTRDSINFYTEQDVNKDNGVVPGNAYIDTTTLTDKSKRTGPYVTAVDISIGDHSMGLLNKATIQFVIPNVTRDLDGIEDTWFRPGRYVKIEVQHPESAIITKTGLNGTGGLLTDASMPNKDRLKKLYPTWDIDELLNTIAQMNVYTFEGLITSFNFSYTTDASVEASISLTGTSNIYTDVSMYLTTPETTNDSTKKDPEITFDATFQPKIQTQTVTTPAGTQTPQTAHTPDTLSPGTNDKSEFYEVLYNRFEFLIADFKQKQPGSENLKQFLLPFTIDKSSAYGATDHFILYGNQFLPKIQEQDIPKSQETFKYNPNKTVPKQVNNKTTLVAVSEQDQLAEFNKKELEKDQKRSELIKSYNDQIDSVNPNRYITLGGLIHFVNSYVVSKVTGSAKTAEIIHTDVECFSNYYPSLVSAIPQEILFLPKNPDSSIEKQDMNTYGALVFYKDIVKSIESIDRSTLEQNGWQPWPGVYDNTSNISVMYPSRIFVNLETIQDIINALSAGNTKQFTLKTFISMVCSKISKASANAISLKLVTYPDDLNKLFLSDAKFLKSSDASKFVLPYSVPMFANHPNGSIVREFSFTAKLPDSVKNLSYVLNSGDDVSEESIAPYMNFMYNAKNPDKINEMLQKYKDRHLKVLIELDIAKQKFGNSPGVPELQQILYKSLTDYIKYPTDDIRKSQQITAPIFPFDVEITIDGINGLRYGDVLTFEALPMKYRVNTVFSIISINHIITSEGQWTTKLRCIMRPSID
jgi:hypothetical protein